MSTTETPEADTDTAAAREPRERQSFSPETKAQILRELFAKRKVVSELAEEFQVEPFNIYNWQTHAFTELPRLFQPADREIKRLRNELEKTRATLDRRELALMELSTDHIELKKKWQETSSGEPGPSPKKGRN
jgi:transposase-like protein